MLRETRRSRGYYITAISTTVVKQKPPSVEDYIRHKNVSKGIKLFQW